MMPHNAWIYLSSRLPSSQMVLLSRSLVIPLLLLAEGLSIFLKFLASVLSHRADLE